MQFVNIGDVWGLHHGGELVARIVATGGDFPWMHGRVDALPGFDEVRQLFAEQEAADDVADFEAGEVAYQRIRAVTSMTCPDGKPVPEYWLRIFDDGTCGWRWHDQPFEE